MGIVDRLLIGEIALRHLQGFMVLHIDVWKVREITLALLGMGKLDAQATAVAPSYNKSHYSECLAIRNNISQPR